jgi:hypothetical protein
MNEQAAMTTREMIEHLRTLSHYCGSDERQRMEAIANRLAELDAVVEQGGSIPGFKEQARWWITTR